MTGANRQAFWNSGKEGSLDSSLAVFKLLSWSASTFAHNSLKSDWMAGLVGRYAKGGNFNTSANPLDVFTACSRTTLRWDLSSGGIDLLRKSSLSQSGYEYNMHYAYKIHPLAISPHPQPWLAPPAKTKPARPRPL